MAAEKLTRRAEPQPQRRGRRRRPGPWQMELDDFVRAFGGAYLIGIPLLYTLEMWQLGAYVNLWKLMAFLAVALGVNTMLAYFAGFKQETTFGNSLAQALDQAVDAVAVGVIGSLVVLLILNRIRPGDPLDTILGRVIIQSIPLSLGASAANSIFYTRASREGDEPQAPGAGPWRATLNDIGATLVGGIFIGISIAPTEEVLMLAAEMDVWHELALMAFSLLVTYAIVFEGEFSPQRGQATPPGPFQHPLTETVLAYCISLVVAFVALYLFDQFAFNDALGPMISTVLVLGLPIAIGGAAGRLVI